MDRYPYLAALSISLRGNPYRIHPGLFLTFSIRCQSQTLNHTLLTTLTQRRHEGLNAPKSAHCTLPATIGISNTFNTVPRAPLKQKISRTRHRKILSIYLTGRHAYTVLNCTPSTKRCFSNGYPQDLVFSLTLSILFMHEIHILTHP